MKSNEIILLLTPGFPEHEQDYWCIPPVQDFLLSLREIPGAPQVEVVALQYPYQPKTYTWNGIKVSAIGGNNRKFPFRFFTWRKALNAARKIHRDKKIGMIHSLWLTEAAWLGQKLAAEFAVPHLCTAMGQDVLPGNNYLNRLKLNKIKIVAISQRQADALNQTCGHKPDAIIPWGLGEWVINRNLNQPRDIDILGVGSLAPVKNYRQFLEVIAQIKKQRPNIRAVLIGEGEEEAMLKQYCLDLGLSENVQFTGLLKRPQVLEWMERSKVLLHTADYEGQCLVFPEALASGMCIVSKPVGMATAGPRWQLAQTTEELTNALNHFLNEPPPTDQSKVKTSAETANEYLQTLYFPC